MFSPGILQLMLLLLLLLLPSPHPVVRYPGVSPPRGEERTHYSRKRSSLSPRGHEEKGARRGERVEEGGGLLSLQWKKKRARRRRDGRKWGEDYGRGRRWNEDGSVSLAGYERTEDQRVKREERERERGRGYEENEPEEQRSERRASREIRPLRVVIIINLSGV